MPDLAEFLLARIAEDEAKLPPPHEHRPWGGPKKPPPGVVDPCGYCGKPRAVPLFSRARAEVESKRRIVKAEASWRRTKPNVTAVSHKAPVDDMVSVTWLDDEFRVRQDVVTSDEYRDRFTEPSPPSDTLKFLGLPYADHPDYRSEWRP